MTASGTDIMEQDTSPLAEERAARLRAERAEARFAVLDEIARTITSSLDLDVVLERIAAGAQQLCGSDTAALFLREPGAEAMVPRYRVSAFPPAYEQVRVLPGRGIGGQAWLAKRPVRTERYLENPELPEDLRAIGRQIGLVAVMAVPIVIDDRVEGLLFIGNRAQRPFTDDDEMVGMRLADQAAVAIQNATLFARERRLRAEAEVLAGLTAELSAALDMDHVLGRVAEAFRDLCDGDLVRIALREAGSDTMTYRHVLGVRASGYDRLRLEPGLGFVGQVLTTGRPYRAAEALTDPAIHPDYGVHFIQAEGIRSAMVVPIFTAGQLRGLIYGARRRPHPFTEEDERIGLRLAAHAAIAIRNAEWFHREQAARAEAELSERRTSFLAQASVLLSSSLDVEATLERVAELAVPHLADFCAVDMVDSPGSVRRLVAVHRDPARQALVREVRERYGVNPAAPAGVASVLRTGRSAFVPDVTDEHLRASATSNEHLDLLRKLGIASWIIAPLMARGRILGVLTLATAESGRRYTVADVGVAEDLARRAAVAIENAQLYREAQAASRAKDEFLATVSHELRTPINAVFSWARLLRQAALDPEARERALEVIERNAQAQVQLIDDLLDVARIVSGKLRLDVRPVVPAVVVEAAVDTVRPAADAKGVGLETVLDPRAGPIMGDPDRLQQIVWNLLTNAVKFTPRGGRIQATVQRVGSHVAVTVSDTGVGIPDDVLPHLFERFQQGPNRQGGLGIGLAVVRHLVELHGGTVTAASDGPGRGASFVVKLPVAAVWTGPGFPELPPLRELGEPRLDGVDVLVVDDDTDGRELVRVTLERAGGSVRTAASVGEALAALGARVPHLVLSDVEMPGADGYALVREIRARPPEAGGRVPVVALTAYGGVRDRIRALEAGFDMHLPKPVDPAELETVVARLARRP